MMISKFGGYKLLSQRDKGNLIGDNSISDDPVNNQQNVALHSPTNISMQCSPPNISRSQPQLQSQQLFVQASLQFIRKKKIANYFLFPDQLIGQGSFAKVYKGMNICNSTYLSSSISIDQPVAIKVLPIKHIMQNRMYQQLVSSQMQIIKQLNHPNVLKCYDILITDNNCYIVTEYCEEGDMKRYVDRQLLLTLRANDINKGNNINVSNTSSISSSPIIKLSTMQHLLYDIYQGTVYDLSTNYRPTIFIKEVYHPQRYQNGQCISEKWQSKNC